MRRTLFLAPIATIPLVLTALGCASGEPGEGLDIPPPQLAALSTYEATLGSEIELYGNNFVQPSVGTLQVVFQGVFEADDGTTEAVDPDLAFFNVRYRNEATAIWESFGPFNNPFSVRGKIGLFRGTATPQIVANDGAHGTVAGQPLNVTFRVLPSILVTEFQPVTASCVGPAIRALGGVPYRMSVQALGFTPASFTYSVAAPATPMEPYSIRHVASGSTDTVGASGDMVLPNVPAERSAYGAAIIITAVDTRGQTHVGQFGIGVHRPIEFFYQGGFEVAQTFDPIPVSACYAGGYDGKDVSYTDTQTETKTRTHTVGWNQNWSHAVSDSRGTTTTVSQSETNAVGFNVSDGNTFTWNMGGATSLELSGSIGFQGIINAGIKGGQTFNYGISNAGTHMESSSIDRSTGVSVSSAIMETETVMDSSGHGIDESWSESVSSSDALSLGFTGRVIATTYGVFYRQTVKIVRRGMIITYNLCGIPQVAAPSVDLSDWMWAMDLAIASQCPPLPPSNLPAAQCNIEPCE